MNSALYPVLAFMCLSCVWMIVSTARIFEFLRRRGEKVSFLWLRVRMFEYMAKYRRITIAEHGKVGLHYYHFVASAMLTLVSAVTLAMALARQRS
jgi:hypothetical protein